MYFSISIKLNVVQQSLRVRNLSGNAGVHKFEMSITLKHQLPSTYCIVLYNFHEVYAAMISIEHNLANTEARAL